MTERYRWPWYWLVVLVALAMAGTAAIALSSVSHLKGTDENFAVGQRLRLQHVEHAIDDYFAHAKQLATVTSSFAASSRRDERRVRWYTRKIFEGRADPHVYGLGVFFAPFAFDPKVRLVNVYDHMKRAGRLSQYDIRHHGYDEVLYHGPGQGGDNYVAEGWFRGAVAAHGGVTFAGPYTENGTSYISVVQAFSSGRRLLGVVSVDILSSEFRTLLSAGMAPGDITYVATPGIPPWISSAPIPKDGRRFREASMPLLYSKALVHVESDRGPLIRAERDTMTLAGIAIAALWILTLVTGIGLIQRWRARQVSLELQRDQERLEAEILVARRIEQELRKAAFTDELTALPNRLAFVDALSRQLSSKERLQGAVFLIDLDRFNLTNETLGHDAGDELLRLIASRLSALVRGSALVARLGGDEFAVLLAAPEIWTDEFAGSLLRAIAEPVVLFGRTIYPQASIGIAVLESEYREPQEVMRDADIAMYAAKKRGRARHAVFDTEMREHVGRESELETRLRGAVERAEIVPYYQPIVDLRTHQTVSFEALARWTSKGEEIPASVFIPFAESRGFVHEIDAVMLRSILQHARTIFARYPESTISINVSAPQLTLSNYADELTAVLAEMRIAPERIRLEITETTMMTKTDEARETLARLSEQGVKVVLDDFGTGYSSLAYLQRLSISGLKIDRSFVELIDRDERAREIVRSIIALAQVLNLSTIAEGVERASQVHELALLGVRFGQGFFFSHALPFSAVIDPLTATSSQ